jgi:capsular polysaccharide transport system permease protein
MKFTDKHIQISVSVIKRPIVLFVLIPWLLYAFYLVFLASPIYESQTQLILKTNDSASAFDPSSLLLGGFAGVSVSNDAKLVEAYVLSRDMLDKLDERLDMRSHYVNSGADFFSRLSALHSSEDFLKYYQQHVDVKVDQVSGVITIRAKAFEPAFAQLISLNITEQAEQFINNISNDLAKSRLAFADSEHQSIEDSLEQVKSQMLRFQSEHNMVDPSVEGAAFQQITYGLESAIAQKRAELNGLQSIMSNDAPAVVNLQRDIAALQHQINDERAKITDSQDVEQGRPMSELIAEFGNLRIQLELRTQAFAASLAALEKIRVETYQQLQYLVVVESSSLPDDNQYPKITYNLSLTAILLLLFFGIVRIVIATVREFSY